jgi:2-polyprenyl-3-methyl-5-hydroxy-6-metoxy-1,4-benzoquinol methylase
LGGFVFPRDSGDQLLSRYSPAYFHEKYDLNRQSEYLNMKSWNRKAALCLDRVEKLRGGQTGLLLDLGCGRGWFLEAARKRGWSVRGLELCPEIAKHTMEQLGEQVYIGSLFDTPLPSTTFDLVTMFDVIEHLESPVGALQICHRILKPGGALVLSTPNFRGLGCRLLGAKAFGIWPDEHIVYFGPASIRQALWLAEFTRIEIASREIYPENVATLISRLLGRNGGGTGGVGGSKEEVWSVKRPFRNSMILRGCRAVANWIFAAIPIGDELLAFAVK